MGYKYVLVDVDTQVDFALPHGALYVPAEEVLPRIEVLLEERMPPRASQPYEAILGSVDSHAYDAWEFVQNGGPFPSHCRKGTPGGLRVFHHLPCKQRFIPQTPSSEVRIKSGEFEGEEPPLLKNGKTHLDAYGLAEEALDHVGIYFEKEVYSLFSNNAAAPVLDALVYKLGGPHNVVFDVIGYCTGGYCVDAAAKGLAIRGYKVRILADACAPLGGESGTEISKKLAAERGIEWYE